MALIPLPTSKMVPLPAVEVVQDAEIEGVAGSLA